MKLLRIAVPNKGRPKEPVLRLLGEVGVRPRYGERQLIVSTSKPGVEILFARAMDIPVMVEAKAADLGITGQDAVAESGATVDELLKLGFGKCSVSLAARERSNVYVPGLDAGVPGLRIATALPNLARAYCRRKKLRAQLIRMAGALESAPLLGIAQAIVDQVETGTTLRENGLVVVDTLLDSEICLIGNTTALREIQKRESIDEIVFCMQGVLSARERVILKVNAGSPRIREVLLQMLPAMKSPDITPLAEEGAVSLLAAVPRAGIEELIMRIWRAGGTDILVQQPAFVMA